MPDATLVTLTYVLVGIVGLVLVMLFLRSAVLWFFGINEIIRLLKKIANETEDEPADATSDQPAASPLP